MSIGTGEYSIGNARSTERYVQALLKKEGFSAQNRAKIVQDLCQKPSQNLFSSRPSSRSLNALVTRFSR